MRPGVYNIAYSDGDKELSVGSDRVRSLPAKSVKSSRGNGHSKSAEEPVAPKRRPDDAGTDTDAGIFVAGDKVDARYGGRER